MRSTVIKASDLGDRWDASFHIALDEVRERVGHLRERVTPDEAARRLEALSLRDLAPLRVLTRGRDKPFGRAEVDRVVAEYPHLALAIMERNAAPAVERLKAEIARNQDALAAVLALSESGEEADDTPSGPRR